MICFSTFFTETIDLIDMQGQLKNLPDKTGDYANMLLDSRQTYVLIKIESKETTLLLLTRSQCI